MSYLCVPHQDYSVLDLASHLSYTCWLQVKRGRVERLEVDGMLAQLCCATRVEL